MEGGMQGWVGLRREGREGKLMCWTEEVRVVKPPPRI